MFVMCESVLVMGVWRLLLCYCVFFLLVVVQYFVQCDEIGLFGEYVCDQLLLCGVECVLCVEQGQEVVGVVVIVCLCEVVVLLCGFDVVVICGDLGDVCGVFCECI